MTQTVLYYRFRLRDADDTTDVLVVSSVRTDTNPYLSAAPSGDGASLDIVGGAVQLGQITLRLVDAVTTTPATRVFTSLLADAQGKPWLLGRKVIVEESTDGTSWSVYFPGYLKRLRLVSAIAWELQVGDTQKAEMSSKAFTTLTPAFPKGVNIIGEPISGGWGPIPAIGQTRFKVVGVTAKRVNLVYVSGPLPPDYVNRKTDNDAHYNAVNKASRPFAVASNRWWNENNNVGYYFPRILLTLTNPATGAVTGTFNPVALPGQFPYRGRPSEGWPPTLLGWGWDGKALIGTAGGIWLDWPAGGSPAQPAVNTVFAVAGGPQDVSDLNPLHIEAHPIDIDTALMAEAGIPYNAASAAAVKDLLGQTLRARLRITKGGTLAEVAAKVLRSPLGYGVRVASDGTREYISVRDLPTAIPGTIITVNDLRSADGVIYDADDASVIGQVNWACQTFAAWQNDRDGGSPPNDLVRSESLRYEVINGDAGGLSGKDHTYELPGHFYDSRGVDLFPAVDFFAAQGQRIFDRFGRGGVRSEVQLLRGTNPPIGSFVCLNLPHLPVAVQGTSPVSQRGQGLRVVQVERSRPNPQGPILTVLDCGRNAQPGLGPTITFAVSALDPLHYAEVTVTNGVALAAAGIELIRFQMATGSSIPTGGGTEFAKRGMFEILANPVITLPKCAAGEKVWVRAQVKDSQLLMPSVWTAWTSVTLTALTAPSGITQSAGANDTERVIRWTLGAVQGSVMVRWKLTANSDWENSVALMPGSVEYTIRGLIPGGGGVTVQVTVVDDGTSPGESAPATVTFTPGSSSPSLPVPWSPAGWAGAQDDLSGSPSPNPDGSFGLDVTAAQWPAVVEVEIATETAIGAGTYGAYITAANPLVLQGYRTRTRFSFWAPNDRLRRKLRARHALPGYTSSGYTAEVVVNPWAPQKAIIPAIATPEFGVSATVQGTIESPTAFLLVQYAPPANPHFDYVRYRVRQRKIGASTWGQTTYVQGGRDGDDFIPVQFGVEAEVRMEVVNTDGVIDTSATPLATLTPKFPVAELLEFSEQSPLGLVITSPWTSSTLIGREPARLLLPFVPNEHCVAIRIFSEEHTTAPANLVDLNDGRAPELDLVVTPSLPKWGYILQVGTCYVIALPLAAAANYRLITIVPYDRLGRVGNVIRFSIQGDATALPAAPTAASNTSVPAGGAVAPQIVTNSVTPQSGTRRIRAYRNGQWAGDFGPWTAAVPHAITHPAVSGQVDRWEYCHIDETAPGTRESARTASFVTTTPTLTLAAPASFSVQIPGSATPPSPQDVVMAGVPYTTDNPESTVVCLRRATSGAGPWTIIATGLPFQQGLTAKPGSGTWYFSAIFRATGWTDSAGTAALGPYPYP